MNQLEYNVFLCCAGLSFFFCNVLSNLMVKCLNDCCHLEVAHTVESLQSLFFFFNFPTITKMHTLLNCATPVCKSLRISAETT